MDERAEQSKAERTEVFYILFRSDRNALMNCARRLASTSTKWINSIVFLLLLLLLPLWSHSVFTQWEICNQCKVISHEFDIHGFVIQHVFFIISSLISFFLFSFFFFFSFNWLYCFSYLISVLKFSFVGWVVELDGWMDILIPVSFALHDDNSMFRLILWPFSISLSPILLRFCANNDKLLCLRMSLGPTF